jgi:hypothetical protein
MDPGLETEAAMTKLMLLVGLLSMFVLLDPVRALGYLGPQAAWIGHKINAAFEVTPLSSFIRGR